MLIAFYELNLSRLNISILGNPVTREDMMMILEDLTSIQIKATDDPRAVFVRLWDVSFPDTNYDIALTNVTTSPSVETCICPQGMLKTELFYYEIHPVTVIRAVNSGSK